ncbi:MAG: ABC transporter substrate-binding protein [Phycisphaerales bacterium]
MENRFGIKDLVNLLLLAVIVALLVLQMIQKDRQWVLLMKLDDTVTAQRTDIAAMRRALDSGAAAPRDDSPKTVPQANGGNDAKNDAKNDPFARLREAMKQPDFAMGDWCVDAFTSQINTLTPLVSVDNTASVVQGYVLESLANLDPDTLTWQPLLATRWEPVDRSEAYFAWRKPAEEKLRAQADADASVYGKELDQAKEQFKSQMGREANTSGEEWDQLAAAAKQQWIDDAIDRSPDRPVPYQIVFHMRPGVTFSDGVPITAHDVEFTYNLIMNEKIADPRDRSYYGRIMDSVKAEGDDRVVFTFRRPYFRAMELAAGMSVLPEHYYKPIVDEDPEKFNQSKGLLVASGPYMLEDPRGWQPSGQVVLVRNERYWGPPAPLARMVFRLFTLDQAQQVAFRNRELDLFASTPRQYVEMLKDTELAKRADHYEYMTPYNGYRYIGWNELNAERKPSRFADKRVRQALTMLIDRPRMLKEVMMGYGQVCDGPFNPLGQQSSPNVKSWAYDIQGAKRLLKEAGFEDRDGDALIEGADGRAFQFKLTYPSGNADIQKMAFFLKDAFARAGILLESDPLEWSVMLERLKNRNFEAVLLGWTSGPETDINQMFSSEQIRPGGDNFVAYRSARLDRLINEARETVDEAERMKLWHECHEILHTDQPYTFLAWGKSLRFVDKRFRNVHLLKAGLSPRSEWYVPTAEQRWK